MYHAPDFALKRSRIGMPAYPGETLFVKGEACLTVLSLRAGLVRAVSYSRSGKRQVMAFFFPGDIVGLPLAEKHRFTAEAICNVSYNGQSSECWTGRQDRLSNAIWAEEKAFMMRGLVLGRVGIRARMAAFLGYVLPRIPRAGSFAQFGFPQCDVASYLATSAETVCRSLRQLREMKVIAMPRKDRLQLLDGARLRAMAEDG